MNSIQDQSSHSFVAPNRNPFFAKKINSGSEINKDEKSRVNKFQRMESLLTISPFFDLRRTISRQLENQKNEHSAFHLLNVYISFGSYLILLLLFKYKNEGLVKSLLLIFFLVVVASLRTLSASIKYTTQMKREYTLSRLFQVLLSRKIASLDRVYLNILSTAHHLEALLSQSDFIAWYKGGWIGATPGVSVGGFVIINFILLGPYHSLISIVGLAFNNVLSFFFFDYFKEEEILINDRIGMVCDLALQLENINQRGLENMIRKEEILRRLKELEKKRENIISRGALIDIFTHLSPLFASCIQMLFQRYVEMLIARQDSEIHQIEYLAILGLTSWKLQRTLVKTYLLQMKRKVYENTCQRFETFLLRIENKENSLSVSQYRSDGSILINCLKLVEIDFKFAKERLESILIPKTLDKQESKREEVALGFKKKILRDTPRSSNLQKIAQGKRAFPQIKRQVVSKESYLANEQGDLDVISKEGHPLIVRNATKDLTIDIPAGSKICLICKNRKHVASLMLGLLGELQSAYGYVINNGNVAYANFWNPFILHGYSIVENIVLGGILQQERLDMVLTILGLDCRFLPSGENTAIEELSSEFLTKNAFKIELARALYSDCDIILLEGLLGDETSQEHQNIVRRIFSGPLKEKTVIFSSNSASVAKFSNSLILYQRGVFTQINSYQEIAKWPSSPFWQILTRKKLRLNTKESCRDIVYKSLFKFKESFISSIEDYKQSMQEEKKLLKLSLSNSIESRADKTSPSILPDRIEMTQRVHYHMLGIAIFSLAYLTSVVSLFSSLYIEDFVYSTLLLALGAVLGVSSSTILLSIQKNYLGSIENYRMKDALQHLLKQPHHKGISRELEEYMKIMEKKRNTDPISMLGLIQNISLIVLTSGFLGWSCFPFAGPLLLVASIFFVTHMNFEMRKIKKDVANFIKLKTTCDSLQKQFLKNCVNLRKIRSEKFISNKLESSLIVYYKSIIKWTRSQWLGYSIRINSINSFLLGTILSFLFLIKFKVISQPNDTQNKLESFSILAAMILNEVIEELIHSTINFERLSRVDDEIFNNLGLNVKKSKKTMLKTHQYIDSKIAQEFCVLIENIRFARPGEEPAQCFDIKVKYGQHLAIIDPFCDVISYRILSLIEGREHNARIPMTGDKMPFYQSTCKSEVKINELPTISTNTSNAKIFLFGVNLVGMNHIECRQFTQKHLARLTPDPVLFAGTVLENIIFSLDGDYSKVVNLLSDLRVLEVAFLFQGSEEIKEFSVGLDQEDEQSLKSMCELARNAVNKKQYIERSQVNKKIFEASNKNIRDPRITVPLRRLFVAINQIYLGRVIIGNRVLSRNSLKLKRMKNPSSLYHKNKDSGILNGEGKLDTGRSIHDETIKQQNDQNNLQNEYEFIERFLSFKLKRNGSNIPMALRQVISVAKAIMLSPRLFLLEETSLCYLGQEVDYLTRVLHSYLPDSTIISVLRSGDTLSLYKRTIILNNGAVLEKGLTSLPSSLSGLQFRLTRHCDSDDGFSDLSSSLLSEGESRSSQLKQPLPWLETFSTRHNLYFERNKVFSRVSRKEAPDESHLEMPERMMKYEIWNESDWGYEEEEEEKEP